MSTEKTTTALNASEQPEGGSRKPSTGLADGEQAVEGGEPKDYKSLAEQLERDYKELQAHSTQVDQYIAEFNRRAAEDPDGAKQMIDEIPENRWKRSKSMSVKSDSGHNFEMLNEDAAEADPEKAKLAGAVQSVSAQLADLKKSVEDERYRRSYEAAAMKDPRLNDPAYFRKCAVVMSRGIAGTWDAASLWVDKEDGTLERNIIGRQQEQLKKKKSITTETPGLASSLSQPLKEFKGRDAVSDAYQEVLRREAEAEGG